MNEYSTAGKPSISDVIGAIPYRMAFAGGWIDQPFVSRHNPMPSGSMVVVGLEPTQWFMERAGLATGTRKVAHKLWGRTFPAGDPRKLGFTRGTSGFLKKPPPWAICMSWSDTMPIFCSSKVPATRCTPRTSDATWPTRFGL